jgi:hypothetical protein
MMQGSSLKLARSWVVDRFLPATLAGILKTINEQRPTNNVAFPETVLLRRLKANICRTRTRFAT